MYQTFKGTKKKKKNPDSSVFQSMSYVSFWKHSLKYLESFLDQTS